MGTFSRDPFGNDDALDLLGDLENARAPAKLLSDSFVRLKGEFAKGYAQFPESCRA